MITVEKKDLEYMMEPIVHQCLRKYGGGESYFNELDGMIKNNETLMVMFLLYIIRDSGIYNVIMSGEIGFKYMRLQLQNKIPKHINLMIVNGGLRKDNEIIGGMMSNTKIEKIPESLDNMPIIFLDDSFYSGKTANKVKEFVSSINGKVVQTYVFYDGSEKKHDDVESLYRYYD